MAESTPSDDLETKHPCIRTGNSVEEIKQAIIDNLVCVQGRFAPVVTKNDYYLAVAYTVRDRIFARWAKKQRIPILRLRAERFVIFRRNFFSVPIWKTT